MANENRLAKDQGNDTADSNNYECVNDTTGTIPCAACNAGITSVEEGQVIIIPQSGLQRLEVAIKDGKTPPIVDLITQSTTPNYDDTANIDSYAPTAVMDEMSDNHNGNAKTQDLLETGALSYAKRDMDSMSVSTVTDTHSQSQKLDEDTILHSCVEGTRTSEHRVPHPFHAACLDHPAAENKSVGSVESTGSLIGQRTGGDRGGETTLQNTQSTHSVRYEQKKRLSMVNDIQTGKESTRGHRALLRPQTISETQGVGTMRQRIVPKNRSKAVNPFWAVKKHKECHDSVSIGSNFSLHGRLVVNRIPLVDEDVEGEHEKDSDDEEAQIDCGWNSPQYRLEAFDSKRHGFLSRALNGTGNFRNHEDSVRFEPVRELYGFRPNMMVLRYLNWTFRSSFVAVSLSACAAFFTVTSLFALAIMALGHKRPDCIYVAGQMYGTHGADFLDAYALSWTTFSTVGYGAVFPGTSAVSNDIRKCTGITVLTTLESFLGILFASFWGAVFFAKVGRAASFAPVEFCDPMVIRYGEGLMNTEDESSDDEVVSEHESHSLGEEAKEETLGFKPSKLPCPILEFRVVNCRWSQHGGEIIDATMNVVASIDERQGYGAGRGAVRGLRRRGRKGKRRPIRRMGGHGIADEDMIAPTHESVARAKLTLKNLLSTSPAIHRTDDDVTGRRIPRKIFCKLEVESYDHPFFKRLWLVRHVLDQHSPLLRQEAKELIRLNGGHWPMELNNPEGVRASVHFDQIVVSLSGTSNADANSVYKQKVYDYFDVCVGYTFCDMLYRQHDGSIGVDTRLLNDVKEQRGGGGETLPVRTPNNLLPPDHILIL